MKKRSFFDRLAGSSDDFDSFDDEPQAPIRKPAISMAPAASVPLSRSMPAPHAEEPSEGQLPVDVYQTPESIIIRTFIAGVRADEVDLSISRDMVTITGSREERENVSYSDFFVRELFWGSFSRTIVLPEEVDVDASTASSKDGFLTIVLPKLDKKRQTKLRVKAG
jgi:HSP20 family protein